MLDTECWIHDTANDFFASIGTKLVSSIEQFLAEPVKLNFVLANITVERYLKYLQNKKTVHLNYLRKSSWASLILSCIYLICNKCAKIVPIFKSGEKTVFTNYRPISLLSSFSKLLDKIVSKCFFCLYKHNVFYVKKTGELWF